MANEQKSLPDYDSGDFGEFTLAKIPVEGIEFQLDSIEKMDGKFGSFRVLVGKMDGEEMTIKVSSKRTIKLLDEHGDEYLKHVVKIIPKGSGMDKTYRMKAIA